LNKEIFFLSGLPRTGSTLLTSILSQNSSIHTEGNSALCQLMWDMQVSCEQTEQMLNKPGLKDKFISNLPDIFYEDANGYIIDKCRSWTMPANLDLIHKYITKTPKIIVMTRPIIEIVESFVSLRKINGWINPEKGLLDKGSEPIMRSLAGVNYAKEINTGQFLFVEYQDLLDNTEATLNRIYDFCGWEHFKHNLKDIKNLTPEADGAISLVGLHDIRPEISKRKVDVRLSAGLRKKAISLG
jgi:sulfotransferase